MIIQPDKWEELQHYKDRKPIWIKLHLKLLDNYKYHMLPVASKAIAPLLWLIASEYQDARIDASAEELAFRLRMPVIDLISALQPLFSSGFFICYQDDIIPLADCYHDACLEKRREETEIEKNREDKNAVSDKPKRASAQKMTDEEWLDSLKTNPAYEGINFEVEIGKAQAWAQLKRRKCSRAFLLNWFNRADNNTSLKGVIPQYKSFEQQRMENNLKEGLEWAQGR